MPLPLPTDAQLQAAMANGTINPQSAATIQNYAQGLLNSGQGSAALPDPAAAPAAPLSTNPGVGAHSAPTMGQGLMPAQSGAVPWLAQPQSKLAQAAQDPNLTGTPKLAAGPQLANGPQAKGATEQQASGPSDLDMALKLAMRGTPSHPLGLSKADKDYLGQLQGQASEIKDTTQAAIDQNKDAVQAFKDQSAALNDDAQLAKMIYDQKSAEEEEHRKRIEAETSEAQGKIEARIASLEAHGVDPNRWWNSKDTGGKIGAIVGMFLQNIGGAFARTDPMQGVKAINGFIAQDIDAQKADMMKNMDLLQLRDKVTESGANRKMALLTAERDSIQTAYTIAQKTVAQKLAALQGNTDAQQRGAELQAKLEESKQQRLAPILKEQYALAKRAETPVGGGSMDILAILKKRLEIKKTLDELQGNDMETQTKRAALQKTLADTDLAYANASKARGAAGGVDMNGLDQAGKQAMGADKFGSFIGGIVPSAIAPGSNNEAGKLEHWKSIVKGTLKQIEPRLGDKDLEDQASNYIIKPSDPPEVRERKVQQFKDRVGVGMNMKGKPTAPGASDDSNPAGLEEDR